MKTVLTLGEPNGAKLMRQMLLSRQELAVIRQVRLIGLQVPVPPYVGLRTRSEGLRSDELARLIVERRAVPIALMRNAVHLVSARDCLTFRPRLSACRRIKR